MTNFTNSTNFDFSQSRHSFLKVFEGDQILTGGAYVAAVHTQAEAHALVRSLIRENMDCATLGEIGGLAYWSDYHYYVRLEDKYFLISRG